MFFKQISDLKNARILICNDNGIDAEGIKILEEETSKICGDVWVAAPDRQKAVPGMPMCRQCCCRATALPQKKSDR